MKIRGTIQSIAAATLLSICFPSCSCSENTPAPAPERAPEVVEPTTPKAVETIVEVPPPIVVDAPPADYEGPVKGVFMDGTLVHQDFTPESTLWDSARIDFNVGEERWPTQGVRLAWLQRDRNKIPFGETFIVDETHPLRQKKDKFEIWARCIVSDTKRMKKFQVMEPYTLTLRLDKDSGEGGLTGYVDLVSTEPPITLRGRFEATFKGERTAFGISDPMAGSPATMSYLFDKRFREQYPDDEMRILDVLELERQKTVDKLMRLGYIEFFVEINGEKTYRSALMFLTLDGWECAEVMEPWQIPHAFPILEPQGPPNGGMREHIQHVVAKLIQGSLTPKDRVYNYKSELIFGGGRPASWCLTTVTYRTKVSVKAMVQRKFLLRKTELGWLPEGEILKGEYFDQKTGEVRAK